MYGPQLVRLRLAVERAAHALDAASAMVAKVRAAQRAIRRKRRYTRGRPPFGMGGLALLPALPSSPPCSWEIATVCPLMLVRLLA